MIGALARPKIEAGLAYQVGKSQLEAGNYATAEAGFSRYVELLPQSPIGYYWRGLTRYRAGQYADAHVDMTRAIALRPTDRTGRVLYLATLDRLGRSSEFEIERANAARLDPEFERSFDRILADIEG